MRLRVHSERKREREPTNTCTSSARAPLMGPPGARARDVRGGHKLCRSAAAAAALAQTFMLCSGMLAYVAKRIAKGQHMRV